MIHKNMCLFFIAITFVGWSYAESKTSSLVGKRAPIFKAQAVFPPDHEIGDFDLQKYIGKRIVLYFYPMDNTPGCSKQAEKFREDIDRLKKQGIVVIGVSCDSPKSHQKFQEKYKLPYILVSDSRWSRCISKMYDAAGFFYSKRHTILINKRGIVIHVFEDVNIKNQIDDILEKFKE